MPRSNRRRDDEPQLDVSALTAGWKREELRRDGTWWVQPISAASAQKPYACPGCGGEIEPGVAHVVTWRADGPLGDARDLAERRHWHTHCWRMRP